MPPKTQAEPAPPAPTDRYEKIKILSAVAWRPAAGDMIDGTIVRILRRETNPEFGPYPLVIVDTGDAQYTAVHAFHSLLREQLKEIKAKPGDQITVVYQGKIESKNDSPDKNDDGTARKRKYHSYLLVSDGVEATADFDWDGDTAPRGNGDEPDDPGF